MELGECARSDWESMANAGYWVKRPGSGSILGIDGAGSRKAGPESSIRDNELMSFSEQDV